MSCPEKSNFNAGVREKRGMRSRNKLLCPEKSNAEVEARKKRGYDHGKTQFLM